VTTTNSTDSEVPRVEVLDTTTNIPVLSFAISVPTFTLPEWERTTPSPPTTETTTIETSMMMLGSSNDMNPVVVGSVVILKNAVTVWVAWGTSTTDPQPPSSTSGSSSSSPVARPNASFGKGTYRQEESHRGTKQKGYHHRCIISSQLDD